MRDVNQFARDLADYINKFIVGTENTKIKECIVNGNERNRGHLISILVVMPEDMDFGEIANMGPAFYAEELLAEFPTNTTEMIGEVVNARVNEYYPTCIEMIQNQLSMKEKTIDDYDPDKIILTASLVSQCEKAEWESFVTRKEDELDLILFIKAAIREEDGQGYFVPIISTEGHEGTKEQWETAAKNSFAKANIQLGFIPDPASKEPFTGMVMDANRFYDFFYLLSLKEVWNGAKDQLGVTKVYIIPNNPYQAIFLLESPQIDKDPEAVLRRNEILAKAVKDLENKPVSVFELDCGTMKLSKYKR